MPKTSSLALAIDDAKIAPLFPPSIGISSETTPTPASPHTPSSPRTIMQSMRSHGQPGRSAPSTLPTNSSEPPAARSYPFRNGHSSSFASMSQGNLLDNSSIAGSSIPEDEISDAGSQASWQPQGMPYGSERERRPSRHAIFQNMLSRSRSTKQNHEAIRPLPKLKTTRERLLESRSREREPQRNNDRNDSLSPHTAPLEPDRGFRDALSNSSSSRNRSADRVTDAGRDTSDTASVNNRRIAHFRQRAGDVAGRASKGIMDKLKGSGTHREATASEDLNYQFKLLHLPLIEQTRRTRLRGLMADAKDKTEFWMPALPYRAIDYLNSKGIEAEGLYRIPGSVKDVKHWQMRFDKEGDVNLLDVPDLEDVHTVGSMLKAWLREMPDALIPKDAQQRIATECVAAKHSGETPQILRDELSKLPPFHYYLLFAITAHVALLYKFREYNKMSYHNLCICFQPCLTIDASIFQFLVEDWKNCWQGCWTEKTYLEEEYRIMEGRPPALPAVPLAPKAIPSRDDPESAVASPITPRPATATNHSISSNPATPSAIPLPKTPTGPPSSYESYDTPKTSEKTTTTEKPRRPEWPSTPPELAPVEPVSPMRV